MRRMVIGSYAQLHERGRSRLHLNFDSRIPQPLDRGLRGQWRIIHLFEGIRLCLGGEDWQNLDVPVIILVDRLPVAQVSRAVQAVGRSMQHEMEIFGNRTYSL